MGAKFSPKTAEKGLASLVYVSSLDLTDPLPAGGIASRGPRSLSRVKAVPRNVKSETMAITDRESRAISAK
jgi:hypothetical protein